MIWILEQGGGCLWGNRWRKGAFSLVCIFHNQKVYVYLIFVLFKHKLCRKTECFSEIQTWIVDVEGEQADHLTTTTAQLYTILLYYRVRHSTDGAR